MIKCNECSDCVNIGKLLGYKKSLYQCQTLVREGLSTCRRNRIVKFNKECILGYSKDPKTLEKK